jgi:outer membrane lipoprotein-sorting protein
MKNKILICCFLLIQAGESTMAQDINVLVQKAKVKIEKVNDYVATGKMKTNVSFLKIPPSIVNLYFKKPGKFSLKTENGVSFIPKGAVNMNLNGILSGKEFTVIDAGNDIVNNKKVRVAKLLPDNDNGDLVLTTLYLDPVSSLILKSKSTTKENGTYELHMKYGKYADFGLPDEILFSFNTRDYKLPKGLTFDFDDGKAAQSKARSSDNQRGTVTIEVTAYQINKGLSNAVFK